MSLSAAKKEPENIKEQKPKKKFQLPNVLVMMLLIMLAACILTYIIPAGEFEMDENGIAIAGTYHSIEQTPVSPLAALNLILDGGLQASSIVIILLFMGGFFGAIFMLDSIPNVINYLVNRFKTAGANLLVLGLFSLMGFIGFFIGGDMMIVFVTLGVILTKQLRLDPITALAVTFLPLFMGFSVGPAGMALIGQMIAMDVPLYSGYGMRTLIFVIYIIITCVPGIYNEKSPKKPLESCHIAVFLLTFTSLHIIMCNERSCYGGNYISKEQSDRYYVCLS